MLQGIFSLRYLLLRRDDERLLFWRDAPLLLGAAIVYTVLACFIGNINYFGLDGIVDRIGSLTSTLTGFYVAALVAAAAFASSHADLDEEIKVGPIHQNFKSNGIVERDRLTRREYVCAIFGYVSLLALALSIASIIIVTVADAIQAPSSKNGIFNLGFSALKHLVGTAYALSVAHLFITTSHGLYYLSYRLYIGDGQILPGPWGEPHDDKQCDTQIPRKI
ncbi:hypothetical protein [Cereibacter sphaeroides]|uniref:hypothetical protein n=1 Tax=Cereibacter sphaeroides TaxID=1063 RepID=UPI000F534943|nr:hypothetical protein [Cereibacter sphaeroides]